MAASEEAKNEDVRGCIGCLEARPEPGHPEEPGRGIAAPRGTATPRGPNPPGSARESARRTAR
jgi:AMMECR1 domain-containing protein